MVAALLSSGGVAFAQGELDAYRYSQRDLNGTARYLGMGGAFGAIGGDISSMTSNPAGLGIYRSSEVVTTLSLSIADAKSDWKGMKSDLSKTKFNFDNIAYVGYFPTGNDEGVVGWNIGFSYNRAKSFNRNYRLTGYQDYSLADYAAAQATLAGIPQKDMPPFNNISSESDKFYDKLGGVWLPALAYQGGLIGGFTQGDNENRYYSSFAPDGGPSRPNDVTLDVAEHGAIDMYNFSFATNISNRVFIGATIAVTDLNYRMTSNHTEYFDYSDGTFDELGLDNWKKTDGTGYSFNLGVIARPADFLRVGVAYNSATWYKMTDWYSGYAYTNIPGIEEGPKFAEGETPRDPDPYTNYRLRTPDKWIFSAAGFIGQVAMISVDYELSNYKFMNLSDEYGTKYSDNDLIREDFGLAQTFKVGAEVKITPQFAVRAGYNWQNSPLKPDFRNGNREIYPSGTVAHYTLDKGSMAYTFGLGYRFTPNFYADLACVFKEYKEDAYTFSKVFEDGKMLIDSEAIGLKTNTTKVALTLGYKF